MKYSFLSVILLIFIAACEPTAPAHISSYNQIQGETMGTYYVVKYDSDIPLKPSVDSLLVAFNMELSTYIDSSLISRFNKGTDLVFTIEEGAHLLKNIEIAQDIYRESEHSFDPTVMPLVNYWGFGYAGRDHITEVDTLAINKSLPLVGYDKITLEKKEGRYHLTKANASMELDFSASAKGYGVDLVANFLSSKGIHNYYVDIGGEQVLKGVNPKAQLWSVGLNQTTETSRYSDIAMIIHATDVGLASSGNYRNFYEVDGRKYSHTINPMTGYPERSSLLGVTVITDRCVKADAYATACMVKGLEKAITFIESLDGVEAVFFYNDADSLKTKMTTNFNKFVKK